MNYIKRKKWPVATGIVFVILVIITALSGVATASPSLNTNSAGDITYLIEIEGISTSGLTMLEMPVSSVEVIEYQDGEDLILRKRPGRLNFSNLVVASDPRNPELDEVWSWYFSVLNGRVDRRLVSIVMMDSQGEQIAQYDALNTWPAGWRVVDMEGQGNNNTVIVEIEIVVEEFYKIP
ncbi:phage tail protein [Chloroflexota bacterium]